MDFRSRAMGIMTSTFLEEGLFPPGLQPSPFYDKLIGKIEEALRAAYQEGQGPTKLAPVYIYRALVTNVVDGDTFDADVALGFYLKAKLRFRLARADCPEMNSPIPATKQRAFNAKVFTQSCILGEEVVIKTSKADSFGRWMAEVEYPGDEGVPANLSDALLNEGLAQLYKKGKDAF